MMAHSKRFDFFLERDYGAALLLTVKAEILLRQQRGVRLLVPTNPRRKYSYTEIGLPYPHNLQFIARLLE